MVSGTLIGPMVAHDGRDIRLPRRGSLGNSPQAGFTLVKLPAVSRCKRGAFTLVELLVVIGIIVVLIALLLPTLHTARRSGWSSQCQNNLKNLCLAFKKTQANLEGKVRAGSQLRQYLDEYVEDAEEIWNCPENSDSSEASYGFNDRMHRLHIRDAGKVVGLDYGKQVAEVTNLPM
jgi:hypothetical protein